MARRSGGQLHLNLLLDFRALSVQPPHYMYIYWGWKDRLDRNIQRRLGQRGCSQNGNLGRIGMNEWMGRRRNGRKQACALLRILWTVYIYFELFAKESEESRLLLHLRTNVRSCFINTTNLNSNALAKGSFNVAGVVVVVWPRNCNEVSVEFLLVASL